MIKFTRTSPVDIPLYEERLQYKKYIYIDKEKLFKIRNYNVARFEALEQRLKTIMLVDSSCKLRNLDPSNIFELLVNYLGCPESRFTSGNQKRGFSVAKTVLEPLYALGYAQDFLEAKLEHAHLKSVNGKPANMLSFMEYHGEVDNYDNPIHRINFNVNQQQNLRYNYKDYDIVALPKEYKECIVAPKGKILVWGDFAQADFRIAYNILLRDETNKDIFDSCEDKYEAMARVIARENNEVFNYEQFRRERPLYKIYTLATIYGKRSGNTREETAFIKKLARYLEKNERYMEFYRRIQANLKLQLPLTIESYFGYETVLSVQQKGGKDSLNKALNTPMQTGTSEIVIRTTNEILNYFYSKGFTEEDIHVYYVRHDEPVFIIDEKVMEHSWMFREFEEILVDDWTPLRADFSFGYTYSVEDPQLMFKYKILSEENKDKITIVEPSKEHVDFYPVKKVLHLGVGTYKLPDGNTVMTFMDCDTKQLDPILVASTNDEELHDEMLYNIAKVVDKIVDSGYGRVVVYNEFKAGDEFIDKISCRFIAGKSTNLSLADMQAEYVGYKYCKKYSIDVPIQEYITMRLDTLKQSTALNLIEP